MMTFETDIYAIPHVIFRFALVFICEMIPIAALQAPSRMQWRLLSAIGTSAMRPSCHRHHTGKGLGSMGQIRPSTGFKDDLITAYNTV